MLAAGVRGVRGVRGVLAPDAGGVIYPKDSLGGFQASLLLEFVGVPLGVPLGVPRPEVGVALPWFPGMTEGPDHAKELPRFRDLGE